MPSFKRPDCTVNCEVPVTRADFKRNKSSKFLINPVKLGIRKLTALKHSFQHVMTFCKSMNRDKCVLLCGKFLRSDWFGQFLANRSILSSESFLKKLNYGNLFKILRERLPDAQLEPNLFIQTPENDSPQYFAAALSSWKNLQVASKSKCRLEYLKKNVIRTLNSMNEIEVFILLSFLTYQHKICPYFPKLNLEVDYKANIQYIITEILRNPDYTYVAISIINRWLLVMPILKELSRHLGWDILKETEAIYLDVDTLYNLYLDLLYWKRTKKTRQCLCT